MSFKKSTKRARELNVSPKLKSCYEDSLKVIYVVHWDVLLQWECNVENGCLLQKHTYSTLHLLCCNTIPIYIHNSSEFKIQRCFALYNALSEMHRLSAMMHASGSSRTFVRSFSVQPSDLGSSAK